MKSNQTKRIKNKRDFALFTHASGASFIASENEFYRMLDCASAVQRSYIYMARAVNFELGRYSVKLLKPSLVYGTCI